MTEQAKDALILAQQKEIEGQAREIERLERLLRNQAQDLVMTFNPYTNEYAVTSYVRIPPINRAQASAPPRESFGDRAAAA